MRRREFITLLGGAAAAWPLAARAQQSERMRRLGWMSSFPENNPDGKAQIAIFRRGLSDLGWIEGSNMRIDYRWYSSDPERVAAELVALAPDVLVAIGGFAVQRLLAVTHSVPIVFAHVNGPVERGFVASLARPGGNATGFVHLEYQMSGEYSTA
jgi:putative ABC transport system substrate-binding protein